MLAAKPVIGSYVSTPKRVDITEHVVLGARALVLTLVSMPDPVPSSARVAETSDALRKVVATRWRIGALLTAVMMAAYFGFILIVAFAKPLAGQLIAGGRVSVGIVLGAAVIVLAPALTSIYVRWANRRYDPALQELRDRAKS